MVKNVIQHFLVHLEGDYLVKILVLDVPQELTTIVPSSEILQIYQVTILIGVFHALQGNMQMKSSLLLMNASNAHQVNISQHMDQSIASPVPQEHSKLTLVQLIVPSVKREDIAAISKQMMVVIRNVKLELTMKSWDKMISQLVSNAQLVRIVLK